MKLRHISQLREISKCFLVDGNTHHREDGVQEADGKFKDYYLGGVKIWEEWVK